MFIKCCIVASYLADMLNWRLRSVQIKPSGQITHACLYFYAEKADMYNGGIFSLPSHTFL